LAFHPNATGCDPRRSCHGIYGVARLKDGVTIQAAVSALRKYSALSIDPTGFTSFLPRHH
jgi:hypothetical protein